MTAVIQRVKKASVSVDSKVCGSCGQGLMILLGVFNEDTEKDVELLAAKISKLRIFTDENDKMNLSINDIYGSCLVVSNFTLCANYAHGNRPDYMMAAKPDEANRLYTYFTEKLHSLVLGGVETGMFGEHMEISMECDGPITIVMDSNVLKNKNKQ